LKEQFRQLEARERKRLISKKTKTQKDLVEVQALASEFYEFFNDFDQEMDFLANKASFDNFAADVKALEKEIAKKTYFFRASQYKAPSFEFLSSELDTIDAIGAIRDNSDFSMPLCAFNTYQLQVYEFREKLKDFQRLAIQDD